MPGSRVSKFRKVCTELSTRVSSERMPAAYWSHAGDESLIEPKTLALTIADNTTQGMPSFQLNFSKSRALISCSICNRTIMRFHLVSNSSRLMIAVLCRGIQMNISSYLTTSQGAGIQSVGCRRTLTRFHTIGRRAPVPVTIAGMANPSGSLQVLGNHSIHYSMTEQ